MIKKSLLLLYLVASFNFALFAQIQESGTPLSFTKTHLSTDIPQVIMSSEVINIPKMLAEDDLDEMENQPLRFAHRFDVSYHLENSGQWETLANGDRIWRLEIWSPGAVNLNLAYRKFKMPKGGKLFVYSSDRSQVIGAFTERNNRPDGYFTTRLIHDDKLTLEYYEPAAVHGQGILEVMTVAHGYRHLDGRTAAEKAGPCQVNVTCAEGDGWEEQKKGVARILMDNAFLCSGTLINNTANDCRPLFSTANHCVMAAGHDAAGPNALVPLYTFYWNYECPCGTIDDNCDPDENQTTAGGTVIVSSGGSGQGVGGLDLEYGDFALIELSESPVDAGYDVYFNGWDRNGNPDGSGYLPQALTGIHHPAGDQKKISTDYPSNGPLNATNIGQETRVIDGQYWELYWEATMGDANRHSVTEGGSSGSPLFASDTKLVIGQLFGGSSENCDNPALDRAVYGGFFYSWTNSDNLTVTPVTSDARTLAPHLDPLGTGVMSHLGSAMPCTNPPVIEPKIAFTSLTSTGTEASVVDVPEGCLDYEEFNIGIRVSNTPDVAVPVIISVEGISAGDSDFSLETTSLTLSDNSIQNIVVRVFDDFIVEDTETFKLSYKIDPDYIGDAKMGDLNQEHTFTILDNDLEPASASNSSEVLLSDDFEDQAISNAIWTVEDGATHRFYLGPDNTGGIDGGDAFVSPYDPVLNLTPPQYLYTTAPDDETLFYTEIDATEYSTVTVSFDWMSGGEGDGTPFDFGTVVISTDEGANYTIVSDILNLSGTTINSALITLPAIVSNSVFRLGFKWQHDGNAGDTQPIAFDNIVVTGFKVEAAPVATTITTTSVSAFLGANSTVHYYDPVTDDVIATITNNEDYDFGCTTVEIDRTGTGAETYWNNDNHKEITSKTYRVIPENPSADKSIDVTLYYTQEEINGWVEANEGESPASELQMIQGNQAISEEDGNGVDLQNANSIAYKSQDFTYTSTFLTPSTSIYGYSMGQVTTNNDALAVNLTQLQAQVTDNSITVSWMTQNEVNNAGFEILRSTNPNAGYNKVGYVSGQGTTTKVQNYKYVDTKVTPGTRYYYQLRQLDNAGNATISNVVHAKIINEVAIALTPNPVSSDLNVAVTSNRTISGTVQIVNLLGQQVYQSDFSPTQNLRSVINTDSFADGVYLLQVIVDGELFAIEKFIKE